MYEKPFHISAHINLQPALVVITGIKYSFFYFHIKYFHSRGSMPLITYFNENKYKHYLSKNLLCTKVKNHLINIWYNCDILSCYPLVFRVSFAM